MPVVYAKDGVKTYVATVMDAAELVQVGTHTFSAPEGAERDEAAEVNEEDMLKPDQVVRDMSK